jgi:elongation factor Tu
MKGARRSEPFLLEIQEEGRFLRQYASVAVVGRVARGTVVVGDALDLVGFAPQPRRVILRKIATIEHGPFFLLDGVVASDVVCGQVLVTPGTLAPARCFRAEMIFYAQQAQLARHPVDGLCRFSFRLRQTTVSGVFRLPSGKQMLSRGDHFVATIELQQDFALEVGLRFDIGQHLGQGSIVQVLYAPDAMK